MADFTQFGSPGGELLKVEGTVYDTDGLPAVRRLVVLSINKEPVDFYYKKETVKMVGQGASGADGSFSIGVRPLKKEQVGDSAHNDENSLIVLAIADTSESEQTVALDQITPVSI